MPGHNGNRVPRLDDLKSEAHRPTVSGLVAENQPNAVGLGGPADALVRAVVASQKILADALEPGGSRDQAFALLLGILDHEEVVRAVAEIAETG